MTATSIAVDHGITIVEGLQDPARPDFRFRALCLCGFSSTPSPRVDAVMAGRCHVEDASGTPRIDAIERARQAGYDAGYVDGRSIPACRPRPTLAAGPIECTPWCVYPDGHGDAAFREDQSCGSELLRVELSLEPPFDEARFIENEGWVSGPEFFDVYAWRPGPDGALQVHLLRGSTDQDLRMTPAEAQQLIGALQLGLGLISETSSEDETTAETTAFLHARAARIVANSPTVLPPCPTWCRYREIFPAIEHGYDLVTSDEDTYSRYHVSGNGSYYLAQEECNRLGVVTFGPTRISVPASDGCEEMSAAETRQAASELQAVTTALEQICAETIR